MIRKLKSDSYRSLLAQDERKNAQATAFALAAGHAVPHPQKSAPSVSIDRIIDVRYVLYSLALLRHHVLGHDVSAAASSALMRSVKLGLLSTCP